MRVRWANVLIVLCLTAGGVFVLLNRDRFGRMLERLVWLVQTDEQWVPVLAALGIGVVLVAVKRLRALAQRGREGTDGRRR